MKKTFSIFTILAVFCLFIPIASADGFIHIYDGDMWRLLDEEQQLCAINYKDGFQNMILIVDIEEELIGEKAVWIFPVPASPDMTSINIVKGFPRLLGYDIEKRSDRNIFNVFSTMRLTQVYTLPFWSLIFVSRLGFAAGSFRGLTIHENIEKMGLTTELVSASDSSSLIDYIASKGLDLPEPSKSILDEYIGEEYSFVISWISDIEKFKNEQEKIGGRSFKGMWTENAIGVFVTFPTEKIYYPLKLTSVYGSKRIPTIIYVLDYVTPELYKNIESYTEVNYFFENILTAPDELRDFFVGYEKEIATYHSMYGRTQGFNVRNVEYTKIKIDVPSKYLTEDLWIDPSAPAKIKVIDFINRFKLLYGLIFFILCSCLASLFSGMITYKKESISKTKFALFGLWNFLTLIGFLIAAHNSKNYLKIAKSQEEQKSEVSFKKIIVKSLLIALVIPASFLLFFAPFMYGSFIFFIFLFIAYLITTFFVSPFVWVYYKDKKIMKFTLLFSVFFIVLTNIFSVILILII